MLDEELDTSQWEARDKFSLMLLERVDALQDECELNRMAIRELQKQLEKTEDRHKRWVFRKMVEDYRKAALEEGEEGGGTYVHSNTYYLKELVRSLRMWAEWTGFQVHPGDKVSSKECIDVMKDYMLCMVAGNESWVEEAGRFFLSMSADDMELFIIWDTLPDLL
jgi:hypothetical protein